MTPTDAEKAAPALFAARVQAAMAAALGVGITEHSFGDTRLMFAARKLKVPIRDVVLEMDKATRLWGVSYADCRDAMARFAAAGGACARAGGCSRVLAKARRALTLAPPCARPGREVAGRGGAAVRAAVVGRGGGRRGGRGGAGGHVCAERQRRRLLP